VAEVVPLLALIPGVVERNEYATQLALAVGTQPRYVEAALDSQRRGEDPRDTISVRPRKSGPEDRIAAQLVRSLIEYPALVERVSTDELLTLLPSGPAAEIVRTLVSRPLGERVDPAAEIVRTLVSRPLGERVDVDAICEQLGDDTQRLLRELAANSAELDADTATRILDDTIQWLRKRLRDEEARALTQQLRGEGEDWRAVLEAKQRLQGQPVRQENRRTNVTT